MSSRIAGLASWSEFPGEIGDFSAVVCGGAGRTGEWIFDLGIGVGGW